MDGVWQGRERSSGDRGGRTGSEGRAWGVRGKVLDRKSSAEFKVAVGHPVRKLCPGESSRPKIEI